jgi:hypothetical protein
MRVAVGGSDGSEILLQCSCAVATCRRDQSDVGCDCEAYEI